VGDKYPRLGLSVSEKRLNELSTTNNKRKISVIEKVEDLLKSEKENTTYTKTEINRMSTNDLKNLAISLFLPNAEYMNGAELKRVLIEHFNL
jgi:ATP sulfurylase